MAVTSTSADSPVDVSSRALILIGAEPITSFDDVNDHPILYQSYGDKIFCDADSSDSLILDYTFRVDEEFWPSYFIIAVEYALASVFAVALARDASLSQLMEQKGLMAMAKARGLDSQQQTNRTLNTSRFITQRRS